MNNNIQKEVRKELVRQCGIINEDYNNDLHFYMEHNKKGEIAKLAIKTIMPLADHILYIQEALGYELMSKWLIQSLKGAHINALHAVAGKLFGPTLTRKLEIANMFAQLTMSQANHGEIEGMNSEHDADDFIKAVQENLVTYYLENFDTFYSIKKTVDMYEKGNDWLTTTAIGVHIHIVHKTANDFGYDANVPVLVLN